MMFNYEINRIYVQVYQIVTHALGTSNELINFNGTRNVNDKLIEIDD